MIGRHQCGKQRSRNTLETTIGGTFQRRPGTRNRPGGKNDEQRQGLYRRSYGVLNFRYRDKDGIWREKSAGTTDRDEALKFKQKWDEDNVNDQLPTDKAEWTVDRLARAGSSQHVLTTAKSRADERSLLRQLLSSSIATKRLKGIALDDFELPEVSE